MRSILIIAALTASAVILFANASLERIPLRSGLALTVDESPPEHTPARALSRGDLGRSPAGTGSSDTARSRSIGTRSSKRVTSDWVDLDTLKGDLRFPTERSKRMKPRRARQLPVDSLIFGRANAADDSTSRQGPSVHEDVDLPRARYRSVDSVSIRLSSDAELTTLPNRTLTAVFAVTNSGHRSRKVLASVDVPAGWIVVRAPSALELAPASTTIQFVTLKIPSDAPAGNAEVGFVLDDGESRTFLASAAILVTVETVREIALDVQSQPDFVAAGETYEVTFVLGNYGNVKTPVKLAVDAASTRYVSLNTHEIDLEPGETREFRAAVKTQSDLLRPSTRRFRVSAEADGHPETRTVVSSGVDVIPVYGRVDPPANPMDVLVTVGTIGDERDVAMLYRAEGSGQIFGGRLDFDMRFPDRRDVARFGQRDEYQSSFRSENVDIVLGDQSFDLSPLTTVGDYAFGAGSTVRTGMFEIDAFGQQSRATTLDYSLVGGGLQIHTSDQAAFGINMLHRDGLYDGTITTIRSIVSPFNGTDLDLECGVDDSGGVQNPACSVALAGRSAQLTYRGRLLRTGENYPGSSSDLTHGSAGLELRLPKGWTVRGDLNTSDRGDASGVARNHWSSLGSIGYRTGRGRSSFTGSLQLMASQQEFTSNGSMLDRHEQTLRISSSYRMSVASVSLAVDIGHAESEGRGYSGSLYAQRLRLQLNPGRSYHIGGFVDHHSGFVSSAPIEVDRWFSGLQAGWMPGRDTRVQGSISRSLDDNVIRRTYTMYEGRLDHRLPWGHRVSGQVRRSVDDGRLTTKLTDYRFGYSVPLSIPLPNTDKSSSKVFGRVYDLATGEGVEGILLHLGDKMTLTDEQGRFRFPAPVSETEYLRVSQRSIGIDQVTHVAMPFPIHPAEYDHEIDIPITAGANLSGVIMRYGSASGRPLIGKSEPIEPIKAMRGVILEARSGERVFRTRTNDRGRFVFLNIPPGEYTVRIVRAAIPSQHRWDAEETIIDLQPADDRSVEFKLVPIRREIRYIEGGSGRTLRGSTR